MRQHRLHSVEGRAGHRSKGCRLLGETQIMGRMLVDGVNLFPILQDGQQLKQLCRFYKVLATLWL